MAFQDSENILLKIGDGATPTESYTDVGGLKDISFVLKNAVVSSNCLDSGKWNKLLSSKGISSLLVSGAGYFADTATEETLRSKAFSALVNNFEIHFGNGDKLSGPFFISEYSRNGLNLKLEEFSISLLSAGEISFIVA